MEQPIMEIFKKALKGILNSKKAADFVKFQFINQRNLSKKLKSLVRGKEKYQIQRLKKFVSHLIKLKTLFVF